MNSEDYLAQSVMVFSKSYMPINQINVKRAIVLLVTNRAEPLDFSGRQQGIAIRSPGMILVVPRYIRLTINHFHHSWKIPAVSRREVLKRDKHTCQYCGSTKHLTLDHVIPRSKGGGHVWNNIVAACERCNSHKGDRTPNQAGMALRSDPKPPTHPLVAFADHFWREHGKEFDYGNMMAVAD